MASKSKSKLKSTNDSPLLQMLNKKEVAKPKPQGVSLLKIFPKNPEHRFGTCWKCGAENEIPGGDFFKCSKDGWLRCKAQMSLQKYTELQAQILESGGQLPDLEIEASDEFDDVGDGVRSDEMEDSESIVECPEQVDNCAAHEQSLFDIEDEDDIGF